MGRTRTYGLFGLISQPLYPTELPFHTEVATTHFSVKPGRAGLFIVATMKKFDELLYQLTHTRQVRRFDRLNLRVRSLPLPLRKVRQTTRIERVPHHWIMWKRYFERKKMLASVEGFEPSVTESKSDALTSLATPKYRLMKLRGDNSMMHSSTKISLHTKWTRNHTYLKSYNCTFIV